MMSDQSDNITNEPKRKEPDVPAQPQHLGSNDGAVNSPIEPRSRWPFLVSGGIGVAMVAMLVIGLGILWVAKARETAARTQSQNNLAQMGKSLHNVAATTPSQGYIPSSYGEFPIGGKTASFFEHLLPYIQEWEPQGLPQGDVPVKVFIAPADPRNVGIDSTISYCSNATVLGANTKTPPRMPNSFYGHTTSIIVVMERSGMDGLHKWSDDSNFLGKEGAPGKPPPFPQIGVSPSAYRADRPHGFSSTGCMVLLGDGSTKIITAEFHAEWNAACDPRDPSWGSQEVNPGRIF
jgi:hypothetical protein